MNESEKAAIEAELAFREKILAIKKKRQELNRETWRRVGAAIGVGFILLLCAATVGFGVWSICKSGCKHSGQNEKAPQVTCSQRTDKNCFGPMACSGADAATQNISVGTDNKNISINIPMKDDKTDKSGKSENTDPRLWLPIIELILKGIFILAGLGVAGYLGIRLLSERD